MRRNDHFEYLEKSLMLKNAPTLAIRSVDTAEIELGKLSENRGVQNGSVRGHLKTVATAFVDVRSSCSQLCGLRYDDLGCRRVGLSRNQEWRPCLHHILPGNSSWLLFAAAPHPSSVLEHAFREVRKETS